MNAKRRKPWLERDTQGRSPLDVAVTDFPASRETLWKLLANGAALCEVWPRASMSITAEMRQFARGINRARAAVRALLCVREAGQLWRWDKFVLREIGAAVWACRMEDGWLK